jgi:hypothetical protein
MSAFATKLVLFFAVLISLDSAVDLWRHLTDKEKIDWFDSNDLCLISSKHNGTFESIAENCDKLTREKGETLQPTRCRAGNSWPSKSGFCAPFDYPFAERQSLHQTVKGYDDPQKKPLSSFFRKLGKEEGALLIIGDSVMQQFYSALACELEREKVWKDPAKFTNTDELQYVKSDPSPDSKKVPISFINVYHFVNGRYDRVPDSALQKMKSTVESMSAAHNSLVVLFNVGLHYVDTPIAQFARADYQKQLTVALKYLHNYAIKHPSKTIRIFWRETTAQHFPTING